MIPVELTHGEMMTVHWLAEKRHEMDRQNGVVDQQVGPQSSAQTDIIGVSAEFAFCKHFNLWPDLDPTSRKIADCVNRDGRTVDIKGTHYRNGKLLLLIKESMEYCDRYVLVTGQPPDMWITGWLTKDEFITDDMKGRMGPDKPLSYIATQRQLRDFS